MNGGRIFAVLLGICLLAGCGAVSETPDPASRVAGEADMAAVQDVARPGMEPLPGSALLDGTYTVDVDSSSSMFRIASCEITVRDGELTAAMTMGGQGYLYVYPGTAAEAAVAAESAYIPFEEDADGAHCFTIPVAALDMEIPCAAYSKNRELWYDRTLVFRSDSLPPEAFPEGAIVTPESMNLADGVYTIEVSLTGGTGRASVESPTRLTVENGVCTARITWGSSAYDYMTAGGETYYPLPDNETSVFEMPVTVFDRPMSVTADTTAMSQPYEIAYALRFDSATIAEPVPLEYAEQFAMENRADGNALVTIAGEERFLIVREGAESPPESEIPILFQPVKPLYLAASAAMDFFIRLDALDRVGMTGTTAENWTLPEARKAMEDGRILYAGKYSAPDFELLLSEHCPLAVESTMIWHTPEIKEQLEALGIPVLVERSSYEPHPLGRMEWIKLYGLLAGKETEAELFFREQADAVREILSGEETGKRVTFFYFTANGAVNVRKPGDYVSRMIELAGGRYLYPGELPEDDGALSTVNMQREAFYAGARDADILIYNGTVGGSPATLEQLLEQEPLLAEFRAVRDGEVWCAERNAYQETAGAGDMIAGLRGILTGTAPDRTAYFYRLR